MKMEKNPRQLRREISRLRQDLQYANDRIARFDLNFIDYLAEQVKAPRCLSMEEAEAAYQTGFLADDDGHPERHDLGVVDVARAAERKLIGALIGYLETRSLSNVLGILRQALVDIGAPKTESRDARRAADAWRIDRQRTAKETAWAEIERLKQELETLKQAHAKEQESIGQKPLGQSERAWLKEHQDFHEAISEELCCSAHNGAGPFSVILNAAKKLVADHNSTLAEVTTLRQELAKREPALATIWHNVGLRDARAENASRIAEAEKERDEALQKLEASEAEVQRLERELSDEACGIVYEKFEECPSCAAKPGSPELCEDCLRRRSEFYATKTERCTTPGHRVAYDFALKTNDNAGPRWRSEVRAWLFDLTNDIAALEKRIDQAK